jgi:hypothetical protein
MTEQDPIRLAESDKLAELSTLLDTAQRRLPDDAAVARVAARLGLPVGGPPPAPPAPSAAPGGSAVAGGKVLGAIAGVALAVGVYLALRGDPAPVVTAAPSSSVEPAKPLVPTAPASPPAAVRLADVESRPDAEVAPVASAEPRPTPSASKRGVSIAASAKPAASAPRAPSELELIAAAERTLRGDPAAALALVDRHRRLYPNGALAEEREVIAIEALAALGQSRVAAERGAVFQKEHTRSGYSQRVSRALDRESKAR